MNVVRRVVDGIYRPVFVIFGSVDGVHGSVFVIHGFVFVIYGSVDSVHGLVFGDYLPVFVIYRFGIGGVRANKLSKAKIILAKTREVVYKGWHRQTI